MDSETTRLTHRDRIRRATQCHITCKYQFHGNIVPHGRNRWNRCVYKLGHSNAFALPPQLCNLGPLTRGPITCQPPHTATCPRHLRAWVRMALPRGLACHVACAQVPRAMSASRVMWINKTPFLHFLKE